MPRAYKHDNGHVVPRTAGGRFRRFTPEEFGIGGVCKACHHLLLRFYDGDPNDPFPDPAKFRWRCYTCEPEEEPNP